MENLYGYANQIPGVRNLPPLSEVPERIKKGVKNGLYDITVGPILLITGIAFVILFKVYDAVRHPIGSYQTISSTIRNVYQEPRGSFREAAQTIKDQMILTGKSCYDRFDKEPVETAVEVATQAFLGPKVSALGRFCHMKFQESLKYRIFTNEIRKKMIEFLNQLADQPTTKVCNDFLKWSTVNQKEVERVLPFGTSGQIKIHLFSSECIKNLVECFRKKLLLDADCEINVYALQYLRRILLIHFRDNNLIIYYLKTMSAFSLMIKSLPFLSPIVFAQNKRIEGFMVEDRHEEAVEEIPPVLQPQNQIQNKKIELQVNKTSKHLEKLCVLAARRQGKKGRAKAVAARLQYDVHLEVLRGRVSQLI